MIYIAPLKSAIPPIDGAWIGLSQGFFLDSYRLIKVVLWRCRDFFFFGMWILKIVKIHQILGRTLGRSLFATCVVRTSWQYWWIFHTSAQSPDGIRLLEIFCSIYFSDTDEIQTFCQKGLCIEIDRGFGRGFGRFLRFSNFMCRNFGFSTWP